MNWELFFTIINGVISVISGIRALIEKNKGKKAIWTCGIIVFAILCAFGFARQQENNVDNMNYEMAEELREQEKYDEAVKYYEKIPSSSSLYSEAKEKIEECVEQYILQLSEKVENLLVSSNFIEADELIKTAEEFLGNTSEIENLSLKVESAKKAYYDNGLDRIQELLNSGNKNEAYLLTKELLITFPNDEELRKILEQCIQTGTSEKPINLLTENTFIGDKEQFLNDYGEKIDNLGNQYSYKLESGDVLKRAYYVCYALEGQYSSLSFELALNEKFKNSQIKAWIEIYDEHSNLLLETDHLTAGSRPEEYNNIDISGVNELYIYAWSSSYHYDGCDFLLTNGFFVY